ncbi:MAG: acyltransferase family protein, partial [Vicingaceae bacterium]|nr:acyltransferase family protein [Vicingaceae bacterium]
MRIDQITFSRFIAAVAIVIYHYGQEISIFSNEYVSMLLHKAYIGVSYFFILSGFVMVIAYHQRGKINILSYLKNRIARVYPVYALALLVLILLTFFRNFNLENLIYYLLMIQSWIPDKATALNYPAWS